MTNATTPAHPGARTSASDEWLDLVDQVLLGLDHALNNRLGALRAFAELLRDEQWRATRAATDGVQKEVERLEETTSVVRLLARPRQPSETGLILEEVMADVVRVQSMLFDVRDTPVEFLPGPPVEPVWSERSGLVRLLSLLSYALRRFAHQREGQASLNISAESDERWARIRFAAPSPMSEFAVSDCVASLATTIGAECRVTDGHVEVRLPTLKARRAGRVAGGPG